MSLTLGSGPLAPRPAGAFNARLAVPETLLYFEPYLPRVRAIFDSETVVDSLRTQLLHESGRLPVFHFPWADVREDLLEPSPKTVELPGKGTARHLTLRVGGRTAPDAAWTFDPPASGAEFLAGHVAFEWAAIDEWRVEDEPAIGHPRDPYSRIDVLTTARHVRVSLGGEMLAETRRCRVLYETGLPPRYYIPPDDVRTELLVPSPTHTVCAYKGTASYWHVQMGERLVEDLVWSYPDPEHDAQPVAGLLSLFNERVDLDVEGVRAERPRTPWSRTDE